MGLKSKPLDQVRKGVPVHEVTKSEMVRVNLVVSEKMRESWKLAALKAKRPMSELIIEQMEIYSHEVLSR